MKVHEIGRAWKYALGSFSDNKTEKYDNWVCGIRTLVLLSYLITNVFIISGVVRHWNNVPPEYGLRQDQ
tara:strand:+ start:452 stop:658 length:207 start_codon:yes stop_codon:yes gene_type:complete